jgi:hypothetical protein
MGISLPKLINHTVQNAFLGRHKHSLGFFWVGYLLSQSRETIGIT